MNWSIDRENEFFSCRWSFASTQFVTCERCRGQNWNFIHIRIYMCKRFRSIKLRNMKCWLKMSALFFSAHFVSLNPFHSSNLTRTWSDAINSKSRFLSALSVSCTACLRLCNINKTRKERDFAQITGKFSSRVVDVTTNWREFLLIRKKNLRMCVHDDANKWFLRSGLRNRQNRNFLIWPEHTTTTSRERERESQWQSL